MRIRNDGLLKLRTGSRGVAIGVALVGLVACGGASGNPSPVSGASVTPATSKAVPSSPSSTPTQRPIPAESNPPGDIPDSTVFVPYHSSAGHFTISIPQGWSRMSQSSSVTFASNLNSISLTWARAASPPTVANTKTTVVADLKASTLAFQLQSVSQVTLPGGAAVEVVYQVNSQPNAVTGKQYRLVIERFELFDKGRLAVLSLSSAVGSDNVDPWRIVSESFRWS